MMPAMKVRFAAFERWKVERAEAHLPAATLPEVKAAYEHYDQHGVFPAVFNGATSNNGKTTVTMAEIVPLPVAVAAEPAPTKSDTIRSRKTTTTNTSKTPRADAAEAAEEERRKRPSIQATKRPLEVVTNDALEALVAANDPVRIFMRMGRLHRITEDEHKRPVVNVLSVDALRGEFARSANYFTITEKGLIVAVDPPYNVVKDALSLADYENRFPPLEGVIEAPVIRLDGSVLWEFGYDPQTRLYYHPSGLRMNAVPAEPTHKEFERAKEIVWDVIGEFPFDGDSSKASAYAMLLTAPMRPFIKGQAPLGLLDAPMQGTGKSLFASVNSIIATGQKAAAFTAPTDEAEWRKAITAMVRAGYSYVLIDNLDPRNFKQESIALHSSALSAVITTGYHRDRILGVSEPVTLLTQATWFASGNNIEVSGDLIRRVYRSRMDAGVSRPWERKGFKHPQLEEYVTLNRGRILWALLVMARAWIAAGAPTAPSPVLGSFEPWSRVIGGILHHAGIEGFLSDLAQLYEEADAETPEWQQFLSGIRKLYGPQWFTAKAIADDLPDNEALRDALPAALASGLGHTGFSKKLGLHLKQQRGRPHGPQRLRLYMKRDGHGEVNLFRVLSNEDDGSAEVEDES